MGVGKSSARSIQVCKGDLTKERTDVVVVCSSSVGLLINVLEAGGDIFRNSYNIEFRKNPTNIIAIPASGQLLAKIIYFIPWEPDSDETLFCKSLKKFVSNAIEKAVNDNYKSIAFPAIGCGQYGCSLSLVAKTLIEEAHQLGNSSKPFEQLESLERTPEIPTVSVPIGNGMIIVEKGNITRQKVDAIIGSPSSIALHNAIIEAAGDDVKTAYEIEYIRNPNSILISTPPGKLSCQRIFFLKWEPDTDDSILRQSIIDFIWNIIQNVISYNYRSIACPAIGCGGYGCSVDIVVKTMVKQIKYHLKTRNLSLTVKFIIRPEQENIYDEFCKQVLASEEDQQQATWLKSTSNQLRFMAMKGKYTKIIKIERIQNERCLLQYLAHCRDFKKRLTVDTEKRLYHGCPEKAANSIIEDCFNRSFAGVNGTAYGVGVYFSSNAVYSHDYTRPNDNGERCMFVARVLIGKTIKGNSSMKTRPVGFDSTSDGKDIYVTYHDAQAFAEYLITY
ncbi:unnamed protein product, partial [Rotaria sp. Silwood1]